MKPSKRIFIFKISLLAALLVLMLWLLRGSIFTLVLERSAGVEFSFSSWKGNPLGNSVFLFPELRIRGTGVSIVSKKLNLKVDGLRLFRDRRLFLECELIDADLLVSGRGEDEARNILELISSSRQGFNKVEFAVEADGDLFKVGSLSAESDDIRIKGDLLLKKKINSVEIDIGISVSPELASGVGDIVRARILTPEDNGWYGASMIYRGNPDFLRALYFAVSPADEN